MMQCIEVTNKLSLFFDGRLDADIEARIREHLEQCPPCCAALEELKTGSDLLRSINEVQFDHEFNSVLGDKIYRESRRLHKISFKARYVWAALGIFSLGLGVAAGHMMAKRQTPAVVQQPSIEMTAMPKPTIASRLVAQKAPATNPDRSAVPLLSVGSVSGVRFLNRHIDTIRNLSPKGDLALSSASLSKIEQDMQHMQEQLIPNLNDPALKQALTNYTGLLEDLIVAARQMDLADPAADRVVNASQRLEEMNPHLARVEKLLGQREIAYEFVVRNEPLEETVKILKKRWPNGVRIEYTSDGRFLRRVYIDKKVLEEDSRYKPIILKQCKLMPDVIQVNE